MSKTPRTDAAMKWLESEFISNDVVEHIRTTMLHLEIELLKAQAELRQINQTTPKDAAVWILKYLLAYGSWYMGAIEGDRMRQNFEMLREKALSLMTDQEKSEIEKYQESTKKWETLENQITNIKVK